MWWFLGGAFRPRIDENGWYRHIFRESNEAADTHANWLMVNGDFGLGAQWMAPDLNDKMQNSRTLLFFALVPSLAHLSMFGS